MSRQRIRVIRDAALIALEEAIHHLGSLDLEESQAEERLVNQALALVRGWVHEFRQMNGIPARALLPKERVKFLASMGDAKRMLILAAESFTAVGTDRSKRRGKWENKTVPAKRKSIDTPRTIVTPQADGSVLIEGNGHIVIPFDQCGSVARTIEENIVYGDENPDDLLR